MTNRVHIQRKPLLPKNAKKVFSGIIFDVYQWEQTMFDGSTKAFEMIKRQDTVITIPITHNEKIIIIKEAQPGQEPVYTFPGGRVDSKKDIDLHALRELKEETDYEPKRLILWKSEQPSRKMDYMRHTFIAQNCRKTSKPHPEADGEKITTHLFEFEELLEFMHSTKNFLGKDEIFLKAYYDKKEKKKLKQILFS